jgi:hypothetical protein
MRPPRPGSLRAAVYDVLAMRPTMSRADIVEAIARTRPHKDRDTLTAKIHDTLNRPNDPRIVRVSRGLYRLVAR